MTPAGAVEAAGGGGRAADRSVGASSCAPRRRRAIRRLWWHWPAGWSPRATTSCSSPPSTTATSIEATGAALRALRGGGRRPRPHGGQPRARVVVQARRPGRQGRPAPDLHRPAPRASAATCAPSCDDFAADCIVVDSMFLGALPLALGPRASRPALACIGVMPYASNSRDTAPFGVAFQPGTGPLRRLRNGAMNWATEHFVLADIQRFARRRLAEAGAPAASPATSSTCSPRWSTPSCRRRWRASSTRARTSPRRCASSGPILAPPARVLRAAAVVGRARGRPAGRPRHPGHARQRGPGPAPAGDDPRPGPRRRARRRHHRRARPRAAAARTCRRTSAWSASSPTTSSSPTSTSW